VRRGVERARTLRLEENADHRRLFLFAQVHSQGYNSLI
jgi:hypothetical protein